MNVLNAKRGRVKTTITNIGKFVQKLGDDSSKEEIKVRLDKLEVAMKEFYAIIDQINDHVGDPDFKDQTDEINEVEENYYNFSSKLRSALDDFASDEEDTSMDLLLKSQTNFLQKLSAIQNKPIEVNLPKITIPPFGGDRTQWKSFSDYFISTIHKNTRLTNTQKFHYLRSSLISNSEAERLIQHIKVTDANYPEAWNKLNERYDIKTQIVSSFIKTFMDQPCLKQQTASGIRQLCDKSDEVIRGLRALGDEAESRDNWLVFIIVNKLDSESRKLWCYETANDEFPSFESLIAFLNRQALALEINTTDDVKPSTSNSKASGKSLKTFHSNNNSSCPVCKNDHRIYVCEIFKSMDASQRKSCIMKNNLCLNCLSPGHMLKNCKSNSSCRVCQRRHHTLIHSSDYITHLPQLTANAHQSLQIVEVPCDKSSNSVVTTASQPKNSDSPLTSAYTQFQSNSFHNPSVNLLQSILPTAVIRIKSATGQLLEARALLDSGSEVSFVTQSLVHKLGISRNHNKRVINGIANTKVTTTKGICFLEVFGNNQFQMTFNALILSKITAKLPTSPINVDLEFANHLNLADPQFMFPNDIDLLIGVDYFFDIMLADKLHHEKGYPVAQKTVFGWVICGRAENSQIKQQSSSCNNISLEIDVDKSLQRFWELENVSSPKSLSTPDEQATEAHFMNNFTRDSDGRFIVRLPFKSNNPYFGNSLQNAVKRLVQMERRFKSNENLRKSYTDFISEYLTLHHMELVPQDEIDASPNFYLPHHAVFKNSSSTTKIRVVFDGSCKTNLGRSLNDDLHTGQVLQDDIFTLLLRFRFNRFAFTADIEKMYRQVVVHPHDRNFQRIVWRNSPNDEIQHLRLTTVTYGTGCGSFLAIRSLQQLAKEEQSKFPRASKIVLQDFYVDDMMSGEESDQDAIATFHEIVELLAKGGFNLRKWSSNCDMLMQHIPSDFVEPHLVEVANDSIKVLGISWFPKKDVFTYKVQLSNQLVATKRQILSDSAKIFDPLGWASPVLIRIKILFQKLWIHKLQWDDEIPPTLRTQWFDFREDLLQLHNLNITRWLPIHDSQFELHAFCDASEVAYSAVVYCRSIVDGKIVCNIVAAKTRVSPLKQISLPRLELSGALLLCNLVKSIMSAFGSMQCNIYAWTDSTIVLAWLSEFPRNWKTFVANRCSEILEILPRTQWNHIESIQNPADCASRGISSADLIDHGIWWHGPNFLQDTNFKMFLQEPKCTSVTDVDKERRKSSINSHAAHVPKHDEIFTKFSSWFKLSRVTAYCLRYINNSKPLHPNRRLVGALSTDEIITAQQSLLRVAQLESFYDEYRSLKSKTSQVKMSSKLISLYPFIDASNIMRVGGRIQNSTLDENMKHPIILCHKHPISELIVRDVHHRYYHAGPTFMFTQLKHNYYILGARNLVRKTVRQCATCRRFSNETNHHHQIMGCLPGHRVQQVRPFSKVGCDFAGPITLRMNKGRKSPQMKGYIALYVCLTTKSIHLEAVSDLSTEAFIASFKRFCGRRGIPSDIFSDNGTNFVGAKRALSEALNFTIEQHQFIADSLSTDGTNWHFIPPSAPQFGGLWEAGVKSTKFHLKRVIQNHILTFEELCTLLSQIEAILNSRPLCRNPQDDFNPLTPGHFLIGQPLTLLPEPNLDDVNISCMSRWQLIQSLTQGFWKRWHQEYLTGQQQRVKWRTVQENLQPGDVVIIKELNLPPGKWSIGQIESCCPGDDGHTRVVVVRGKGGTTMKRPITKLIKLFTDEN